MGDLSGLLLGFWFVSIMLGLHVAAQKGRGYTEAFVLALIFGPFGVLIGVLLPTLSTPQRIRIAEPFTGDAKAKEPETGTAFDQKRFAAKHGAKVKAAGWADDLVYLVCQCGQRMSVPEREGGNVWSCPGCRQAFIVPTHQDADGTVLPPPIPVAQVAATKPSKPKPVS